MKRLALPLALIFLAAGCNKQPATSASNAPASSQATPVSGPFTDQEIQQYAALDPIDTHTHAQVNDPGLYSMLKKLNLHILDILVDDDNDPNQSNLAAEDQRAWAFVHSSDGHASLCSTFNPFTIGKSGFTQESIHQVNKDFSQGAVAVKIWKNLGMEIKDAKGKYVMPDNPALEPIFKDIAAQNKTLIAHVADPNSIWEAPNVNAPDYGYYTRHPEFYMYGRANAPDKQAILDARDRILQANPNLRVVGAHLGSMEKDFDQLGRDLDKYPNFAVDLAARMPYVEMQPRATMIAFITKYQDRLIYGTDNELFPGNDVNSTVKEWGDRYANDWRYFATDDVVLYKGQRIQGLALPQPILRKLYHDNAVKWFPGILGSSAH